MSDFEKEMEIKKVSIPSSGSIQFLHRGRRRVYGFQNKVSIPSSGSIQFLQLIASAKERAQVQSLNPLKRVNSILTGLKMMVVKEEE